MNKEKEDLKEQVSDLKGDLRVQNKQRRIKIARNSGLITFFAGVGLLGGILLERSCNSGNTAVENTPISTPISTPIGKDRLVDIIPTRVAGAELKVGQLTLSGFPESVDAKNVDTTKGNFKNTIGLGSEMIIAEPGVLKVGWDFPQDQFKAAEGHIYHYDSGNQFILQTPESFVNVPEGAFAMFNGNAMTIEVAGNDTASFRLAVPGPVSNHNIVIIRGLYPDGSTPADRNRIAKVTGYTPGTVLYDMYPTGGFVSAEQVEQIANNALTNNPNCGAEACKTVTMYGLDVNTGALVEIKKSDQSKSWTSVFSNIK